MSCLFLEDCPLNSFNVFIFALNYYGDGADCVVVDRADARVDVFQGSCIMRIFLRNSFLEFHFTVDLLFRIQIRQFIVVQILSAFN